MLLRVTFNFFPHKKRPDSKDEELSGCFITIYTIVTLNDSYMMVQSAGYRLT